MMRPVLVGVGVPLQVLVVAVLENEVRDNRPTNSVCLAQDSPRRSSTLPRDEGLHEALVVVPVLGAVLTPQGAAGQNERNGVKNVGKHWDSQSVVGC